VFWLFGDALFFAKFIGFVWLINDAVYLFELVVLVGCDAAFH
jgi:hypothetical protein